MEPHRIAPGLPCLAGILLLSILWNGCATPSEDVRARSRDAVFPSLRLRMDLGRPQQDDPPRPGSVATSLELEGWRTEDTFEQPLHGGGVMRLDDLQFKGPTRLRGRVRLDWAEANFRGLYRANQHFGLEGRGGLTWSEVTMRLQAGGLRDDETLRSLGPLVGAGLLWRPKEPMTLYARGSGMQSLGASHDTDAAVGETGLQFDLTDHLGLFAGWRWVDYDVDRDTDVNGLFLPPGLLPDQASLKLHLSGPVFGLALRF